MINKQIMLNNIPAHNHTVYSYLQALLTDHHNVSTHAARPPVSIHAALNFMDTGNNVCNHKYDDVDDHDSDITLTKLSRKILSYFIILRTFWHI